MLQAQHVRWVIRYFASKSKGWKSILSYLLDPVGQHLVFFCNYSTDVFKLELPKWYSDILKTWQSLQKHSSEKTEISNQVIWNNSRITFNSRSVFKQSLFEKGICKFSDIL